MIIFVHIITLQKWLASVLFQKINPDFVGTRSDNTPNKRNLIFVRGKGHISPVNQRRSNTLNCAYLGTPWLKCYSCSVTIKQANQHSGFPVLTDCLTNEERSPCKVVNCFMFIKRLSRSRHICWTKWDSFISLVTRGSNFTVFSHVCCIFPTNSLRRPLDFGGGGTTAVTYDVKVT